MRSSSCVNLRCRLLRGGLPSAAGSVRRSITDFPSGARPGSVDDRYRERGFRTACATAPVRSGKISWHSPTRWWRPGSCEHLALHFAEAGGGGCGRESARGGEFRYRAEDPADWQGEHQIAAVIVVGPEHPVEADAARGARGGADDGAAFEHAAQPFDVGSRPVGEVADGAPRHAASVSIVRELDWLRDTGTADALTPLYFLVGAVGFEPTTR